MQLHETTGHTGNDQLVTVTPLSAFADSATVAIQTVLDSLTSEHSKRAYERHLTAFISWHRSTGQIEMSKAVVQRYAAQLHDEGMRPSSINQRLSAIRKLASEAGDNGALDIQDRKRTKAGVQRYAAQLHDEGMSPSSITQRLPAIRKLASEAGDNGALDI